MPELLSVTLASLDGYVADRDGSFAWAEPGEDVHAAVNDMMRSVGTHLYGRRMYEVLLAWETWDVADEPAVIRDFAEIWRGADKIVYSRTLDAVASARTRIERSFDPGEVRRLKGAGGADLAIGGPTLVGEALRAGLVDRIGLFLFPVIVGGGLRAMPADLRLSLELFDERRFGNGVVYLGYRVGREPRT